MSTQQKNDRNKPRLGRGLSSLISISDLPVEAQLPQTRTNPISAASTPHSPISAPPQQTTQPHEIPLSQITPNPHQPRRSFDDSTLADLAASIKSTGVIQPILVKKVGQQYQLIAGERRLRAARIAGLATIPAIIRDIDIITQAQIALIENIQREDLNPIDRAQGYRTLIDQLGLTQSELAGRLGEDRSSIANFLRLLDLSDSVKTMVRDARLSVGHAKLIAGIPDKLEQERLANLVLLQALSVRNLERAIKEGTRPTSQKPPISGPAAHLQDLEKTLSRQLGLRVQLRSAAKKGKGRLIIHYASLDQFDELLTRLKVSAEAE